MTIKISEKIQKSNLIKNISALAQLSLIIITLSIPQLSYADSIINIKPSAPDTPQVSHQLNKVVAIINQEVITQLELDQQTKQAQESIKQSAIPTPDQNILEKQVLNHIITKKIELQLAKKNNISVSKQEIDNALNEISQRNNIPLSKMMPAIITQYGSIDNYKKNLKDDILIRKLKQQTIANSNIVVTDQQVKQFLSKQQHKQQAPIQYQVANILIPIKGEPTPKSINIAKDKAQQVLKEIKSGMLFAKAAATYSAAGNALKGGVLPWGETSSLPDAFTIVKDFQIGQTSSLIRTPSGFNIIKLINKRNATKSKLITTEYKLQQIAIDTTPILSEHDAKARLLRIKNELTQPKPKKTFAQMALTNSDDHNSSVNQGVIGWHSKEELNSISPILAQKITELKTNQISEPFSIGDRWFLVKLMDKKDVDNTANLEKNNARQYLFEQQALRILSSWESELRGSSYIKIIPENLR